MDITKIAKTIVAKKTNSALVKFIQDNPESNYSAVRSQVNRISGALKDKYNDGKFVTKQDQHSLTWAIIDAVNGKEDEISIDI